MPVSDGLLTYVLEQLSALQDLTSRRMFGGVGLYSEGAMFAVMDDDQIYFRVDDATRPRYKALGAKPWEPMPGREGPSERYYELPHDILDDQDRLTDWARKATSVARSAKTKGGKGGKGGTFGPVKARAQGTAKGKVKAKAAGVAAVKPAAKKKPAGKKAAAGRKTTRRR